MSTCLCDRLVRADPARTWEVFADFDRAASRLPAILRLERVGETPWGVGARFRETRVVFRREATEEMEIVRWEPEVGYSVAAESCGTAFRTDVDFTPEEGGTRVRMSFAARPLTLAAKLMSPLGKLMMKSCMKTFAEESAILAGIAEGGPERAD